MEFKLDMKEVYAWKTAWGQFPREAGKHMARCINDMAFEFRDIYFDVISERYTIRDPDFIKKTITVDKARPRTNMNDIYAVVGTWQGSLKGRFSGYTEELGGASKKERVITRWGRVGMSPKGIAQPWARLRPGQKIPKTDDLSGLPQKQRLPAMVDMMARGKIKSSATFIMGKGTANHGLYRFRSGGIPGKGLHSRADRDKMFHMEKLDKIQQFDKPVKPPLWDWREETEKRLGNFFDSDFIFNHYIAPAMLGIMPGKR